MVTVGRDGATYSSDQKRGGVVVLEEMPEAQNFGEGGRLMLTMDAPEHTRYRKLVNRGFTPRQMRMLEPHIRELTAKILDEVIEQGGCDYVVDVAAEVPLQVIVMRQGKCWHSLEPASSLKMKSNQMAVGSNRDIKSLRRGEKSYLMSMEHGEECGMLRWREQLTKIAGARARRRRRCDVSRTTEGRGQRRGITSSTTRLSEMNELMVLPFIVLQFSTILQTTTWHGAQEAVKRSVTADIKNLIWPAKAPHSTQLP